MKDRISCEKSILKLSIAAGFCSAVMELIVSIATRSQAVLMDSVFDISEVLVSLAFVLMLPLIYRPETEKKPYGYAQLENIFLIVKGTALTVITVGLISENMKIITSGGREVDSLAIGLFQMFISAASIGILLILRVKNRKVDSPVVSAEILSWKMDAFGCMGVGMAFLLQPLLSNTPFAFASAYTDQVIAIVIAVIMLPRPVKIVWESLRSLIFLAPKRESAKWIKQVAKKELEGTGMEMTYCDCVQTGRQIWVDIYMKNSKGNVEIFRLREIRRHILKELQTEFEDVHVDITPDLE